MCVYKIVSFSVVVLLVTVLFVGAVIVPAAAQTDTMQYRYNAQHTGDYSAVAGSRTSLFATGGVTSGGAVQSSPAVVNGVVYVEGAANIYALNATNGAAIQGTPFLEIASFVLAFFVLAFVGLVIARVLRGGRHSMHAALLAGPGIMRKRMGIFTIALLIWLTYGLIYGLSSTSYDILHISFLLMHAGSFINTVGLEAGLLILSNSADMLATILLALAIVGIITHYAVVKPRRLCAGAPCAASRVLQSNWRHMLSHFTSVSPRGGR
ncbi:MAG: hypothetical protein WCA89_09310 [Terracidiphilus sp.]